MNAEIARGYLSTHHTLFLAKMHVNIDQIQQFFQTSEVLKHIEKPNPLTGLLALC